MIYNENFSGGEWFEEDLPSEYAIMIDKERKGLYTLKVESSQGESFRIMLNTLDIDNLKGHKISHKRIHGLVPRKDETRRSQDKQIEEHDNFSNGKTGALIQKNGNHLRTVCTAAMPNNNTDADANGNTAEDSR